MPVRPSLLVRCFTFSLLIVSAALGQEPGVEDQAIDAMRGLPQIGESDQRRMRDWIELQLTKLSVAIKSAKDGPNAASNVFRTALRTQFDNGANSPAFRSQLRAQLAQIAAARFAEGNLERWVGFALARVLVDYNAIENVPAFVAGLKSKEEVVRYLSAEGLAGLAASLPGDKESFDQAVAALREAGLKETSPVVIGRIYAGLAYPAQIPAVFDPLLAIFDSRLAAKRAASGASEAGEIEAFEFFRNPAVLSALSPEQKNKLAAALAVFLRLDAERYDSTALSFDEMDRIERRLDCVESILSDIVGAGKGGKIRDELGTAGHEARGKVRAEAYKWVGDPANKDAKGALNDAPYNIPVGAP